jgi:hypothetical protein
LSNMQPPSYSQSPTREAGLLAKPLIRSQENVIFCNLFADPG